MADTYGLLPEPVPVPADGDPVSDPALEVLLDFAQAVLNAKVGDAWAAVAGGAPAVVQVFANDPEREYFNDKTLPALYGYRKPGAAPYNLAEDYRVTEDVITLLWVMPSVPQFRQRLRSPAINGVGKMLDRSIERGREPVYVKDGDPDTQAATLPALPSAVKLAVATSTAPASYSGGALDGTVGAADIAPRRAAIAVLSGDPASFALGSTITISGTNALGLPISHTLTIASVPATLSTGADYATVTGVTIDAQAGTAGQISIGLAPFAGRGSVLLDAMGAMMLWPAKAATPRLCVIKGSDVGKPIAAKSYPSIEFQISVRERLFLDPAEYDGLEGADLTTTRTDGETPFEEASL